MTSLFIFHPVLAQEKESVDKEPTRFEYYFNSGFGYYFPLNNNEFLGDRGASYSFNIQVNYKSNYFIQGYFDMSTINYKKDKIVVNGVVSSLDYKLNANNIGLDFGYTLPIKSFSPYAYIGAGVTFMDTPFIKSGTDSGEIIFGTKTKCFPQFNAAIGIDYEITRYFVLFGEIQYSSTFLKTSLDNQRLHGVSLLLGFKTPLWY
jgi:hypothetical protein